MKNPLVALSTAMAKTAEKRNAQRVKTTAEREQERLSHFNAAVSSHPILGGKASEKPAGDVPAPKAQTPAPTAPKASGHNGNAPANKGKGHGKGGEK